MILSKNMIFLWPGFSEKENLSFPQIFLILKWKFCKIAHFFVSNPLAWRKVSITDFNTDECIGEFIERKWTSGLFWAVGAAEKKKGSVPIMSNFFRWVFQLFWEVFFSGENSFFLGLILFWNKSVIHRGPYAMVSVKVSGFIPYFSMYGNY